MGADLSDVLMRSVYARGKARGHTVARLSGDDSGLRYPDKQLKCTVPFSTLPQCIFNKEKTNWRVIHTGRWSFDDHVTLGEGRAVCKLLRILASNHRMHRSKVASLQDNMPVAGSFAKGRSPAPGLINLIRIKAAQCVAAAITLFMPWVQTSVQPADAASRVLE